METDLYFLMVSALLILLPAVTARNALVPALVFFSFQVIILPLRYGLSGWILIASGISLLILVIVLLLSFRKRIFSIDRNIELKKWRVIARPFALLFIPINICPGHGFLLYLLGILSIIFISVDIYRLFSRRRLSLFFKSSEIQRFSSMTSFVVAIFIVFLLFPDDIAYLCLAFIIFGDMAAKVMGLKYGRTKIIHERTLEGSLGFLAGCIYAGFIIFTIFGFKFSYLVIGAACATLSELFSFNMDDNFTVGILTGGCLMALLYFQVI